MNKDGYINKIRSNNILIKVTNLLIISIFLINTLYIDVALSDDSALVRVRAIESDRETQQIEDFFGTKEKRQEAEAHYATASAALIKNPIDVNFSIVPANIPNMPASNEPIKAEGKNYNDRTSAIEDYFRLCDEINELYSAKDPESFKAIQQAISGSGLFFGCLVHNLLAADTLFRNREEAITDEIAKAKEIGILGLENSREALRKLLEFADLEDSDPDSKKFLEIAVQIRFYDDIMQLKKSTLKLPANPLPGMPVADFASGVHFAYFMPNLDPNCQYIAVDKSLFVVMYLNEVKKRLGIENLTVMQKDVMSLDFSDKSLGVVRLKNVIKYVPNLADKLPEIIEWVAPGGHIIFANEPETKVRNTFANDETRAEFIKLLQELGFIFTFKLGTPGEDLETRKLDNLTFITPGGPPLKDFLTGLKGANWEDYVKAVHDADRTSPLKTNKNSNLATNVSTNHAEIIEQLATKTVYGVIKWIISYLKKIRDYLPQIEIRNPIILTQLAGTNKTVIAGFRVPIALMIAKKGRQSREQRKKAEKKARKRKAQGRPRKRHGENLRGTQMVDSGYSRSVSKQKTLAGKILTVEAGLKNTPKDKELPGLHRELYKKLDEEVSLGEFIATCTQILRKMPYHLEIAMRLARKYKEINEHDSAIAVLEVAIKATPTGSRNELLRMQESCQEAKRILTEELTPTNRFNPLLHVSRHAVPDGKGGYFIDTLGFDGDWDVYVTTNEPVLNAALFRFLKSLSVISDEVKRNELILELNVPTDGPTISFGRVNIEDNDTPLAVSIVQENGIVRIDISVSRDFLYKEHTNSGAKAEIDAQRDAIREFLTGERLVMAEAPHSEKTPQTFSTHTVNPKVALISLEPVSDLSIETLRDCLNDNGVDRVTCRKFRHPALMENFLEELSSTEELGGEPPNIIGISVGIYEIERANALIKELRARFPDAFIFIGGPTTQTPEQFASLVDDFDFMIRGEADEVFPKMVLLVGDAKRTDGLSPEKIEELKQSPVFKGGVMAKLGQRVIIRDLSHTCQPATFHLARPREKRRAHYWESSRGCPNNCAFCALIKGMRYRFIQAEEMKDWLLDRLLLHFDDNINRSNLESFLKAATDGGRIFDIPDFTGKVVIYFTDDDPLLGEQGRSRMMEFCDLITQLGLENYFEFHILGTNINNFYNSDGAIYTDLVDKMEAAGFEYIIFGTDGFAQAVIDQNDKGYSLDTRVIPLNKYLRNRGFRIQNNSLLATPYTSARQLLEEYIIFASYIIFPIGFLTPAVVAQQATTFTNRDVVNNSHRYMFSSQGKKDHGPYVEHDRYRVPKQFWEYFLISYAYIPYADPKLNRLLLPTGTYFFPQLFNKEYDESEFWAVTEAWYLMDKVAQGEHPELYALGRIYHRLKKKKMSFQEAKDEIHKYISALGIYSFTDYLDRINDLDCQEFRDLHEHRASLNQAMQERNIDDARTAFQDMIAISPNFITAYVSIAGFLINEGRVSEGLEIFERSMRILYHQNRFDHVIEQVRDKLKIEKGVWDKYTELIDYTMVRYHLIAKLEETIGLDNIRSFSIISNSPASLQNFESILATLNIEDVSNYFDQHEDRIREHVAAGDDFELFGIVVTATGVGNRKDVTFALDRRLGQPDGEVPNSVDFPDILRGSGPTARTSPQETSSDAPLFIQGMPVEFTDKAERDDRLRIACVKIPSYDFERNTQLMCELLPEMKARLGKNAPDIMVFPEMLDAGILGHYHDKPEEREKALKEIVAQTGITIAYCIDINTSHIREISYHVIQPTEDEPRATLFNKSYYDELGKAGQVEERVITIGGKKVAFLICAEASDVGFETRNTKTLVKYLDDAKPQAIIMPSNVGTANGWNWASKVVRRFRVPVIFVNKNAILLRSGTSLFYGDDVFEHRSGFTSEEGDKEGNKKEILIVDVPDEVILSPLTDKGFTRTLPTNDEPDRTSPITVERGDYKRFLLYPTPLSAQTELDDFDKSNFQWDAGKGLWLHNKAILGDAGDIRISTKSRVEPSEMKNCVVIRTRLGFSFYAFDRHGDSDVYMDNAIERGEMPPTGNYQLFIDEHSDTHLAAREAGYTSGDIALTLAEQGKIGTHIWVDFDGSEENDAARDREFPDSDTTGMEMLQRRVDTYRHLNFSSYFEWTERPRNVRAVINICSDAADTGSIVGFLDKLFKKDGIVPSTVQISTSPGTPEDPITGPHGAPFYYGDIYICRDVAKFVISEETLKTIEANIQNLRPAEATSPVEESDKADRTSPSREDLVELHSQVKRALESIQRDSIRFLQIGLQSVEKNNKQWRSILCAALEELGLEEKLKSLPDPNKDVGLDDALHLRFASNEITCKHLIPYLRYMLEAIKAAIKRTPELRQPKLAAVATQSPAPISHRRSPAQRNANRTDLRKLLAEGPHIVEELAGKIGITTATVWNDLRSLTPEERKNLVKKHYEIRPPEQIKANRAHLRRLLAEGPHRVEKLVDKIGIPTRTVWTDIVALGLERDKNLIKGNPPGGKSNVDRTSPVREDLQTLETKIIEVGKAISDKRISTMKRALRIIKRNHLKWHGILLSALRELGIERDEFILKTLPDPSGDTSLHDALNGSFANYQIELDYLIPYLEQMIKIIKFALRIAPVAKQPKLPAVIKPVNIESVETKTPEKQAPKPPAVIKPVNVKPVETKTLEKQKPKPKPRSDRYKLDAETIAILAQIDFTDMQFRGRLFDSPRIDLNEFERTILNDRHFLKPGAEQRLQEDIREQFGLASKQVVSQREVLALRKVADFYQYLDHEIDFDNLDKEPVYKFAYFEWPIKMVFKKLGIETIDDLRSKTRENFLELKNFGKTKLQQIIDALAAHDLSLQGDSVEQSSLPGSQEDRTSPTREDLQTLKDKLIETRTLINSERISTIRRVLGMIKKNYLKWHGILLSALRQLGIERDEFVLKNLPDLSKSTSLYDALNGLFTSHLAEINYLKPYLKQMIEVIAFALRIAPVVRQPKTPTPTVIELIGPESANVGPAPELVGEDFDFMSLERDKPYSLICAKFLHPDEAVVLRLMDLGIDGVRYNSDEIAMILNITKSHVERIEDRARGNLQTLAEELSAIIDMAYSGESEDETIYTDWIAENEKRLKAKAKEGHRKRSIFISRDAQIDTENVEQLSALLELSINQIKYRRYVWTYLLEKYFNIKSFEPYKFPSLIICDVDRLLEILRPMKSSRAIKKALTSILEDAKVPVKDPKSMEIELAKDSPWRPVLFGQSLNPAIEKSNGQTSNRIKQMLLSQIIGGTDQDAQQDLLERMAGARCALTDGEAANLRSSDEVRKQWKKLIECFWTASTASLKSSKRSQGIEALQQAGTAIGYISTGANFIYIEHGRDGKSVKRKIFKKGLFAVRFTTENENSVIRMEIFEATNPHVPVYSAYYDTNEKRLIELDEQFYRYIVKKKGPRPEVPLSTKATARGRIPSYKKSIYLGIGEKYAFQDSEKKSSRRVWLTAELPRHGKSELSVRFAPENQPVGWYREDKDSRTEEKVSFEPCISPDDSIGTGGYDLHRYYLENPQANEVIVPVEYNVCKTHNCNCIDINLRGERDSRIMKRISFPRTYKITHAYVLNIPGAVPRRLDVFGTKKQEQVTKSVLNGNGNGNVFKIGSFYDDKKKNASFLQSIKELNRRYSKWNVADDSDIPLPMMCNLATVASGYWGLYINQQVGKDIKAHGVVMVPKKEPAKKSAIGWVVFKREKIKGRFRKVLYVYLADGKNRPSDRLIYRGYFDPSALKGKGNFVRITKGTQVIYGKELFWIQWQAWHAMYGGLPDKYDATLGVQKYIMSLIEERGSLSKADIPALAEGNLEYSLEILRDAIFDLIAPPNEDEDPKLYARGNRYFKLIPLRSISHSHSITHKGKQYLHEDVNSGDDLLLIVESDWVIGFVKKNKESGGGKHYFMTVTRNRLGRITDVRTSPLTVEAEPTVAMPLELVGNSFDFMSLGHDKPYSLICAKFLPPDQAVVLRLMDLGIDGVEYDSDEVAMMLDMTKVHVEQLESKARENLQILAEDLSAIVDMTGSGPSRDKTIYRDWTAEKEAPLKKRARKKHRDRSIFISREAQIDTENVEQLFMLLDLSITQIKYRRHVWINLLEKYFNIKSFEPYRFPSLIICDVDQLLKTLRSMERSLTIKKLLTSILKTAKVPVTNPKSMEVKLAKDNPWRPVLFGQSLSVAAEKSNGQTSNRVKQILISQIIDGTDQDAQQNLLERMGGAKCTLTTKEAVNLRSFSGIQKQWKELIECFWTASTTSLKSPKRSQAIEKLQQAGTVISYIPAGSTCIPIKHGKNGDTFEKDVFKKGLFAARFIVENENSVIRLEIFEATNPHVPVYSVYYDTKEKRLIELEEQFYRYIVKKKGPRPEVPLPIEANAKGQIRIYKQLIYLGIKEKYAFQDNKKKHNRTVWLTVELPRHGKRELSVRFAPENQPVGWYREDSRTEEKVSFEPCISPDDSIGTDGFGLQLYYLRRPQINEVAVPVRHSVHNGKGNNFIQICLGKKNGSKISKTIAFPKTYKANHAYLVNIPGATPRRLDVFVAKGKEPVTASVLNGNGNGNGDIVRIGSFYDDGKKSTNFLRSIRELRRRYSAWNVTDNSSIPSPMMCELNTVTEGYWGLSINEKVGKNTKTYDISMLPKKGLAKKSAMGWVVFKREKIKGRFRKVLYIYLVDGKNKPSNKLIYKGYFDPSGVRGNSKGKFVRITKSAKVLHGKSLFWMQWQAWHAMYGGLPDRYDATVSAQKYIMSLIDERGSLSKDDISTLAEGDSEYSLEILPNALFNLIIPPNEDGVPKLYVMNDRYFKLTPFKSTSHSHEITYKGKTYQHEDVNFEDDLLLIVEGDWVIGFVKENKESGGSKHYFMNVTRNDLGKITNARTSPMENEIVFQSENGRFKVRKLNTENFEQYKDQILEVAHTLDDPRAMEIETYIVQREAMATSRIIPNKDDGVDFIAEIDGKVAGFIACTTGIWRGRQSLRGSFAPIDADQDSSGSKALYGWIFGVRDGYEHRGVGNILLWLAAQEAQKRDTPFIIASVGSSNTEFVEFLTKRGFEIVPELTKDSDLILEAETQVVISITGSHVQGDLEAAEKANWQPLDGDKDAGPPEDEHTLPANEETRKVKSSGQIKWKNKQYFIGRHFAGEDLILMPFDGETQDSGFKAFYGKEQVAWYNATEDKFKRIYETRKVSSNGTITWKYKRYYVGTQLAGEDLILTPFDGETQDSGFRAFYGRAQIAWYNAAEGKFERTYEIRKVSPDGIITWDNRPYPVGTPLAGEDLILTPFDGQTRESGFKAFYGKEQVAWYNAAEDRFKKTYETRKVSSNGTITWKYKRYYVGTQLAGEDLILTPFDGETRDSGFKAFYGKEQVAWYNATEDKFKRIYETRKVSPGGVITWKYKQYYVGKYLAGEDLILTPFDGKTLDSGFKAFYGKEQVAWYNTAEDRFERTYEIRKVSSGGQIKWKKKPYSVGTHLAGEDLILTPFDGKTWDSGFRAFYGKVQIAWYNAAKDQFKRTYEIRKVSSNGQITWKYKQYYVGTHLAGEDLILKPFDGKTQDSGFKAFYGKEQVAWYNAAEDRFERTPSDRTSPLARLKIHPGGTDLNKFRGHYIAPEIGLPELIARLHNFSSSILRRKPLPGNYASRAVVERFLAERAEAIPDNGVLQHELRKELLADIPNRAEHHVYEQILNSVLRSALKEDSLNSHRFSQAKLSRAISILQSVPITALGVPLFSHNVRIVKHAHPHYKDFRLLKLGIRLNPEEHELWRIVQEEFVAAGKYTWLLQDPWGDDPYYSFFDLFDIGDYDPETYFLGNREFGELPFRIFENVGSTNNRILAVGIELSAENFMNIDSNSSGTRSLKQNLARYYYSWSIIISWWLERYAQQKDIDMIVWPTAWDVTCRGRPENGWRVKHGLTHILFDQVPRRQGYRKVKIAEEFPGQQFPMYVNVIKEAWIKEIQPEARTSPLEPVQVEGYTIYTSKDVYPPDSSSTVLFLRGTRPRKNSSVWDVGTATGVIGIAGADRDAGFVLATDIGLEEIEIARHNVGQSDYADRIEVEQADGLNLPAKFAGQKFDHIYCNPTLPGQEDAHDRRRSDPEMQFIDHILQNASNYLKEGGTLEVNYLEMALFFVKVYEYGWEPVVVETADYTRLSHGGVFDLARFTLVRQKVQEKRQIALEEIKLAWIELARLESKRMSGQPLDNDDQALLLKMAQRYKTHPSFNARLLYKEIYILYGQGAQFPLLEYTRLNELYPEQHPQEDRTSPMEPPSQNELLARGGLVSIDPDADSVNDLLQAIKLTKEEKLYVNQIISGYKNRDGNGNVKQNIEILPLLVRQALGSGYWIPALIVVERIKEAGPEFLIRGNDERFYEIEREITEKLRAEKLERSRKIKRLHRLAVESDRLEPRGRNRTLRRAERASKDEISWLEIVMDMCAYRISWEEVGGMKRGSWSKSKWLTFIEALKERHKVRYPGRAFNTESTAKLANGVVSRRDLWCLPQNHGLTRDDTSFEIMRKPLRKPADTVKVIEEVKRDMPPNVPFTRPNLIRHSNGELKKHDLDNLKQGAPALYASLGFVGAQQKTIILNKPQPPNGKFPKIKIGKIKVYSTIGRRIREIREQMGLTQPDFGLRVGYPGESYARGRISGLERSDENGKGISDVEISAIEIVAGIAKGQLTQGIKRSLKRPEKVEFIYSKSPVTASSAPKAKDRTSPATEQPGKVEIINEDVVRNISPKVIALDWHETIFTGMSFWKEIIAKMAANIFSDGKTPSNNDWAKAADFVRTSIGRQPLANKRRLIEVANAMGLNPTQTAEELADIYTSEIDRRLHIAKKTWKENPPVVSGIKKLLEALKPKVEMHVISGGRTKVHRECARQIGFTGFFKSFHGSDEYDKQEFLEKIMRDKSLLPNQLVMIGDGAYDIKSAKDAGCVAVGIAYDEQSRQMLIDAGADIIINNNFLDLDAILGVLNIRTSPMEMLLPVPVMPGRMTRELGEEVEEFYRPEA